MRYLPRFTRPPGSLRPAISASLQLIGGGVFGRAAFVENVFAHLRERFGLKRRIGARRMREADWEDLCVLRDLKNDLKSRMGGGAGRRWDADAGKWGIDVRHGYN